MKKILHCFCIFLIVLFYSFKSSNEKNTWIRINQLGYTPNGIKVAVWCSKISETTKAFNLIDSATNRTVFTAKMSECFDAYGPFTHTTRLNFSSFKKPGKYYLKVADAVSPMFEIDENVYSGSADFCLKYMRQQRSGFNPFLNDSCHTHDGFTVYAPVPDGTHVNVSGGWHDASDYLQYTTTSANAAYHLLSAYRDFPNVFRDEKLANGLNGRNNIADVLDEAKWGLDWLLKMHPQKDWMFNQLGDDRDHRGMRIPKEDTNYYGRGLERPVYFLTGEPQGLFKYKNRTKGTSTTAARFASAFALGAQQFQNKNSSYSNTLSEHASSALNYAYKKIGVTQTAPGGAPYFYEEDNWTDDMELAYAAFSNLKRGSTSASFLDSSFHYAQQEKFTPWLGADTAKHYQWYPFINLGHYELAKQLKGDRRKEIISYYKDGIEKVWNKAKQNAFYRGVPFIWCSNNLTTSFAVQCYWYRTLTNDKTYNELEQANIDWLFGCNPWGTSMVYGLPSWGDTPTDPHSAFTHLKNYPIDGGLIDGPVYTSIYSKLIGITLYQPDEYAHLQSNLAVYHDDYGDYSTNEPTMDGTASLIYLLAAKENETNSKQKPFTTSHGAIVRGDSTKKEIALIFTGDEFGEGLSSIQQTLQKENVKASFFFTGRFYRNKNFTPYIQKLQQQKHYLGPHSDMHLLYNDWTKRDSTLITQMQFNKDIDDNIFSMQKAGINHSSPKYFIPPYEWWNDTIASWTEKKGLRLFSFTSGTFTNADYTWPELGRQYRTNEELMDHVIAATEKGNLNGNIFLIHVGTDSRRKEKFYTRLPELIRYFKSKGYSLKRVDELLKK
jgi:endoglucanase